MRISFGGGHRRGGPRLSFELGPLGSAIMCLISAIIGGMVVLYSIMFFNIILLIAGVLFVLVGIFGYRSNIRQYRYSRKDEE